MKYTKLSFNLWSKCTSSCAVCLHGCNPNGVESLSVAKVKDILDFASKDKDITQVYFSGGEIFMDLPVVEELVSYAALKSLHVICATNGFWSENYKKTQAILKKLQDKGLKEINLSVDVYHQKYVKIENIRVLLKALSSLNIKSQISVIIDKKNKYESIRLLGEIAEYATDSTIALIPIWTRKSTGEKNDIELVYCNKSEGDLYCSLTNGLLIHFNGKVYPCGNFALCGNEQFSVGDINTDNFSTIYERAKEHLLVNNLILNGLQPLYKELKESGFIEQTHFSNGCEFCLHALEDEKLRSFIEANILKKDIQRVKRFIYLQNNLI